MSNAQIQDEVPPEFRLKEQTTDPAVATILKKKSYKWPIFLMVWPIALIIIVIMGYALSNGLNPNYLAPRNLPVCGSNVFNDGAGGCRQSSEAEPFGEQTSTVETANLIQFIITGISVSVGPISFIVGLGLLVATTDKNKKRK